MKVLRKKCKGRKLNNRGFSIVEILIAMAILGVVSLTIYSFMMTGSRFYQKASSDADIQSEAQLVANTISDLIIDCEVNISYDDQISNSINSQAGSIQAQGRTLEISNTDYQFLIFHDGEKLFYLERRPDPANPAVYEAYDINNSELLAENITAFDVDLSRVSGTGKGKNIVTFTMTYEEGGRSYSGNYQVNLRNAITVSANSITPQTKEPNMTRVDVSPKPIYIDIKGRTNPVMWVDGLSQKDLNGQPEALRDDQRERKFTANSDAVNVGRDDIYNWSISGENGTATIVSATNQREFTIRIEEDLTGKTIPNHFTVVAEATIPNSATGEKAKGTAEVYYKKINSLAIVPTRGVTNDKVDPGDQATFSVNIDDFNLSTADKTCTWVLEYRTPVMADYVVCTDASYASGRTVGTAYLVQLGSKADENCKFRLTATSNWDDTWSDVYTFGVTELAKVPGVNTASRGVEMDMTELFTNGEYSDKASEFVCEYCKQYNNNNYSFVITGGHFQNASGQDAEDKMFQLIVRDGKLYIYIDYESIRYVEDKGLLAIYDAADSNLEITFEWTCTGCGNQYSKDGLNWRMPDISISPASPVRNSAVLLKKGGHQDTSFTTVGYNLSKKSQIGIYLDGANVNTTDVGTSTQDMNNYLSASYISGLGNRYTLCLSGIVRLTAKPEQNDYPKTGIPVTITLDSFYQLVVANNLKDTTASGRTQNYGNRSSYDLTVYIANVEGMDLFVQGPSSMASTYNTTTVVYYTNADAGSADVTAAQATKDKTFTLGEEFSVADGKYKITIDAVRSATGAISSYTMTVNGKSYYYNTTYHYWRPNS